MKLNFVIYKAMEGKQVISVDDILGSKLKHNGIYHNDLDGGEVPSFNYVREDFVFESLEYNSDYETSPLEEDEEIKRGYDHCQCLKKYSNTWTENFVLDYTNSQGTFQTQHITVSFQNDHIGKRTNSFCSSLNTILRMITTKTEVLMLKFPSDNSLPEYERMINVRGQEIDVMSLRTLKEETLSLSKTISQKKYVSHLRITRKLTGKMSSLEKISIKDFESIIQDDIYRAIGIISDLNNIVEKNDCANFYDSEKKYRITET